MKLWIVASRAAPNDAELENDRPLARESAAIRTPFDDPDPADGRRRSSACPLPGLAHFVAILEIVGGLLVISGFDGLRARARMARSRRQAS